jgi:uncharacterized membrane protein/thiol-disulfide isomerase/thioredoxin
MVQTDNTGLKKVAAHYAQLLAAKVTATSIQKDIEEHPSYPSLLSLSDTFSKYRINNKAYKIEKSNFDELEAPFVAFADIPGTGKDFVLVIEILNGKVRFLHKGKKAQSISKESFLKGYQNVVWFAEVDKYSGESNYSEKLKQEETKKLKKASWCLALAVLIIISISLNATTSNYFSLIAFALLKLAGIIITLLLLVYETDKSNAFVKNLCSVGGHTDCDAVLSSKAAKIKGISWAELGFFYFAATALFLLFPTISFNNKVALLAIANAFTIPYIIFSIFYQWRVVKQWCPLCLSVQAVLFIELISSIFFFWLPRYTLFFPSNSILLTANSQQSNTWLILILVLCVLLPATAWYGVKSLLTKAKDASLYEPAYKRLQYNPEVFLSLLRQQPKAPDGWQELGVSVGKREAANIVIKVCNPHCGPCAKAHRVLEEILRRNSNVQLKIIFINKNNEEDRGATVVKHFLGIAAKGDSAKTQQALDDWYFADEKDYEAFAEKHPLNAAPLHPRLFDEGHAKALEAMSEWCKEGEIAFTPTIFVNGYKLPQNYDLEELKHIL